MKFVSHILYGKLVDLYKDNQNISIRFVRASQKLKIYTGPEIECKLKGSYAQRKFLSIEYCKWFLQNKFSEEQKNLWLSHFTSGGKTNDISDALLYCINFLNVNEPIKKEKEKKIKTKKVKKVI